jgi:hypothetical protein
MGLQRGWPDFLLVVPGGLLHVLELKRRGEIMAEEQESFAAWCQDQGPPFVCTDNLCGGDCHPIGLGHPEERACG